MRPLATDTHDFPAFRRDGKIYVDKTMFIHRLVSDPNSRLFFVSRPRRFGKSLTISALKALFRGRRELFKGLYIDKTDWTWETYPVIHFEFNDLDTTRVDDFEKDLADHVQDRLTAAGYAYDESRSAHWNFGKAIETLSAANGGKGVVILVDEYDAPVGRVTYRAEDVQSNGRADVVAEHKRGVFIFELKVDEGVDKAFKQIRDKKYAEPYLASGKPIWLIGLSFDSKTRHLVDATVEPY